jgi:2-polyprenyl-6-methoxyphenol hydroxylase-like FAD-dependent oxidoreductase
MAKIVVTGGGVVGLAAAMLLAGDGHEVTVLERDAASPPEPTEAWDQWERRGVNQFRMPHFFLPRFRIVAEAELPNVLKAMDDAGTTRVNPLTAMPDSMNGGHRDGDDRFEALTGRRPIVEAAIARQAEETPGVTVRRGTALAGLVVADDHAAVPHAVGVRTEGGEELRADVVVDATGRRSPLPHWLEAAGARPPVEELDDSGFVYYGRHFRSADGSIPPALGPYLQEYGSISVLTLPGDNGTWGVALIASARDSALRAVRDADRWEAVVRSLPLAAHWLDGEPLEKEVVVMAKIEDRHRSFVVDGTPVATGVLPVGDSWACTNPSVGRGASIGLLHAVALRDLIRSAPVGSVEVATAWHAATEEGVEPLYRATLSFDRGRLGEIEALARGEAYDGGPEWEITKALQHASFQDPDCLRAFLDVVGLTAQPGELFADEALFTKVLELGAGWRDAPPLGPDREQLLALVGA